MSVKSLLFRTLVATLAALLLQYGLTLLYLFVNSGELQGRVADAVEARQTWRLHHSNEREVFTCLLCGHAVQPANGHGVHKDAYSCIQCNHTSFASECNVTLPAVHYAYQVDLVVGAYDVPSPLASFLRFTLTVPTVSVHPVSVACVFFSLATWFLYLHFMAGIVSAVLAERELVLLRRMQDNIRNARVPPSVSDDASTPVRNQLSFDSELRQRQTVLSP
jgi:hypothetical protein